MGLDRNHIAIAENGSVIELTAKTLKIGGAVPAGEVYVDGSGVGDVGAVVMRDRKRLAEDGMVVVVLPISSHDGGLLSPPEIVAQIEIVPGIMANEILGSIYIHFVEVLFPLVRDKPQFR